MKLFFCPACYDLVAIHNEMRYCMCRESYGRYRSDEFNSTAAEMGGMAIPLGVDNKTLLGYLVFGYEQPPTLWRKDYSGDLERIEDDRISTA